MPTQISKLNRLIYKDLCQIMLGEWLFEMEVGRAVLAYQQATSAGAAIMAEITLPACG
jgi:hypothetical protein